MATSSEPRPSRETRPSAFVWACATLIAWLVVAYGLWAATQFQWTCSRVETQLSGSSGGPAGEDTTETVRCSHAGP